MSCGTCAGSCCAVIPYLDPEDPSFARLEDAAYIADMLEPINLVTAADRMERFGTAYWADRPEFDWEGRQINGSRRLMKCKHWDEKTRLCGAYDSRPRMCAEYPYYARDCDYECGFSLSFQEMWDRHLRLYGPEAGTPSNIVRGEN